MSLFFTGERFLLSLELERKRYHFVIKLKGKERNSLESKISLSTIHCSFFCL